MAKTFLCTRPRLYAALTERGIDCKPTANPFNSSKLAWTVELTEANAAAIAEWYNAEQLPTPASVAAFQKAQATK